MRALASRERVDELTTKRRGQCALDSSSRIPAIAEPFFQALEAEVTFTPVMTADELREGLAAAFG